VHARMHESIIIIFFYFVVPAPPQVCSNEPPSFDGPLCSLKRAPKF
jgi:hypothetical protein